MDNKELQKTVNPIYLTAKSTLGLLKRAGDPDAVALMPYIALDTSLQEKAKVLPDSIGLCYKTAQLARYEIYNTAALQSGAPEMGGGEEELAFIRAMVGVSKENFESTLDFIDSEYGSLSAYLENALGFSAQDQEKLRSKLLK
ncbi:MAG: tyrosine-protein phosphatase [Bacteroidales bacterium]|nr:tyrosine-protein phosphatase [Bacteroidales bacterium]